MTRNPFALLIAAVLCNCGDGSDPQEATQVFTDTDARIIAEALVDQASVPSPATAIVVLAQQTPPPTGPFTISNTLACASGVTVVTGSGNRDRNTTTRVATVTWAATATHNNCRLSRENRTFTFTSGSIQVQGNSSYQMPAQAGGTPTLQSLQLSRSGSVTISSEAFNGSCGVNLTTLWVAAQNGYRTTGTVCDKAITSELPPRGFPNARAVPPLIRA